MAPGKAASSSWEDAAAPAPTRPVQKPAKVTLPRCRGEASAGVVGRNTLCKPGHEVPLCAVTPGRIAVCTDPLSDST